MRTWKEPSRSVATLLGWSLLYVAAVQIGKETRAPAGISLAWPAAAVATVWLLSSRYRRRGVLVVALLGALTAGVNLATGGEPLISCLIGLANAGHAVVAVGILHAFGWRTARAPRSLGDIPVLLLASAVSAAVSAIAYGAAGALVYGPFAWDLVGIIATRNTVSTFVGTATLLAVPRVLRSGGPAGVAERVLLVTVTVAATYVVTATSAPIVFTLVPLTVVAAIRCGAALTSVLVGVQGLIVVVAAITGRGLFADQASPASQVLLAQGLILVLGLVGLALALEEHERATALEASRLDRDRLRDHIDAALVANAHVIVDDSTATVASTNPAMAELCRREPDELVGTDPLTWFDGSAREILADALADLVRGHDVGWHGQLALADDHGGGLVDAALSPVRSTTGTGAAGGTVAVTVQLLDVTARKRAEERLAHLALHDELTGLANRTLARDRLESAQSHAAGSGQLFAVLYIDVDHFKQINDTRGHDAGDTVLKEVARRLLAVTRAHDTVARLGGDEFLLVCPSLTDRHHADEIASRVLGAFADDFKVDGATFPVTTSVGVMVSDGADGDADEVLRRADAALYAAKNNGRQRYEVSTADLQVAAARAVRMIDDLRRAFESGELVMEYQPIVDMRTGSAVALEALVRWRHPVRGVVAACEFVHAIESSELVFDLSELSVRSACSEGAALVAAGHELPIHVNISPRQLEHGGLVDLVRAAIDETGFPPHLLTLEITETWVLTVSTSLLHDLGELRDLGVRIAVDDFGTGYSGPAHLLQMPVDLLKLDRSFVVGIEDQRGARAVSGGVLAIARGLGIGSIAEGVETASEEAALLELGYRFAQGHRYAPALPSEELERWLSGAS